MHLQHKAGGNFSTKNSLKVNADVQAFEKGRESSQGRKKEKMDLQSQLLEQFTEMESFLLVLDRHSVKDWKDRMLAMLSTKLGSADAQKGIKEGVAARSALQRKAFPHRRQLELQERGFTYFAKRQ